MTTKKHKWHSRGQRFDPAYLHQITQETGPGSSRKAPRGTIGERNESFNEVEVWCGIPGWPRYFVSNLGRVKGPRGLKKLTPDRDGYLRASLSRGGKSHTRAAHRLVLQAFAGGCGQHARHLNGDRTDNRLENLRWGTARDNMRDRREHGTWPTGENHPRARLTPDVVRHIRALRASGVTNGQVSERMGIATHLVRSAVTNWKHLTPTPEQGE